jgi:hypothetical protein
VSLNIFSAAFSTAPSSAAGHLPTPTPRQARPPTISMPRACPPSEAGRADGGRVNHETEVAEVNVEEGVASSPFFVPRGESVASLLLVTCHLQRQEAVTLFPECSAQYEITLLLRVLKLGTFAVLVAVEPNVTVKVRVYLALRQALLGTRYKSRRRRDITALVRGVPSVRCSQLKRDSRNWESLFSFDYLSSLRCRYLRDEG